MLSKYLTIHLDESGTNIMVSFFPTGDTDTEAITQDDLKRAIHDAGFAECQLNESALSEATLTYNSGAPFKIPVAAKTDGEFSIRLDNQLLSAFLTCSPAFGGEHVLSEHILSDAIKQGIGVALNVESIEQALIHSGENILIASGKLAVMGEDGRLESLIPKMQDHNPHLNANGLTDFRDLGDILTVQAGDALLRRIPPTNGESGIDLSGKPIPAKPGQDVVLPKKIKGAIIDPNDPNILIAEMSGIPIYLNGELSVEQVYTVENVDLHSGNINFNGMVHVTNDVHAGMTIKASGDIYVDGTVEGAILDAGGDIVVKGGIIGVLEAHADNFTPSVTCSGSCTSRFVQNAKIVAVHGIFINEFSMQSELSAGQQIIVGKKGSSKGHIIGGTAHAGMLIKAQVIGSDAYVKTLIITGTDPALHERLNHAIKIREEVERKLSDIVKLLDLASHNPDRIPLETVESATATRNAMDIEIHTLLENERELQNEMSCVSHSQIIVEKNIFCGVDIKVGIKQHKINTDKNNGIYHIQDGELVFT